MFLHPGFTCQFDVTALMKSLCHLYILYQIIMSRVNKGQVLEVYQHTNNTQYNDCYTFLCGPRRCLLLLHLPQAMTILRRPKLISCLLIQFRDTYIMAACLRRKNSEAENIFIYQH